MEPTERDVEWAISYGQKQDWMLCHKADTSRAPHPVELGFVQIRRFSASSEMIFYRCQRCGQFYLYDYSEFNDWSSLGDRFEMWHYWYPVSVEEIEHIRRDVNYVLSPREHLVFGS